MPRLPLKYADTDTWIKREWNYMVDYLSSLRPSGMSVGVRQNHTINGVTTIVKPRAAFAGGAAGNGALFYFASMEANYLKCYPDKGDGTPDKSADLVKIAKPAKLRNSIETETFPNGDVVNYDYSPFLPGGEFYNDGIYQFARRDAYVVGVSGFIVETIVPYYLVDDELSCMKVSGGVHVLDENGNDLKVDWIHTGPHHWATAANQAT